VLTAVGLATGAAWPSWRAMRQALGIGTLMFVASHGAIAWASTRNPSGITALLVATIPLWIAVLEWLAGVADRPSARTAWGIGIGFLGSMLLFWPAGDTPVIDPLASLVTAVSALSWAAGTLKARRTHLSDSVSVATGLPMLLGGFALALISGVFGEWQTLHVTEVTGAAFTALIYLILMGSLLGFSAYLFLLRTMPASRVATYAYVNPIVALALGAWLGGEPLAAMTLVAAAVSLAGVYLSVSAR
jgi:drug/metabolite transporter (DMT)-like permease